MTQSSMRNCFDLTRGVNIADRASLGCHVYSYSLMAEIYRGAIGLYTHMHAHARACTHARTHTHTLFLSLDINAYLHFYLFHSPPLRFFSQNIEPV